MSRIVAWTGHRPDIFRDPAAARAAVNTAARDLVTRAKTERFLVGGQRGVDTWAAQADLLVAVRTSIKVVGGGTAETIALAKQGGPSA